MDWIYGDRTGGKCTGWATGGCRGAGEGARWRRGHACLSGVVGIAIVFGSTAARAQYTEKFEAWSATSANTWQTKSLAGAPFNVPANAVVEIAVRNSSLTNGRSAGVRAVGSSLERRLTLHAATGGGVDAVTLHVQTNSSSQIQHYAENITDVDFVLLGYWECSVYTERFDAFNGSATWTDLDLNVYGVAPGGYAEIVISNTHPTQAYSAGVRTNGSTLERRVTLQAGENVNELVTMVVRADTSASATIETRAENAGAVDFYLVGYWSTPPGSYTEKFVDLGSPSTDGTWEDKDVTANSVPDGAVIEVAFANDDIDEENQIGVRANGSTLSRLLNLRQDSNGEGDFGRMHVATDASAIFEFYHQDVSDLHHFYLLGYWVTSSTIGAILGDHLLGQQPDAFRENGNETNAELFAFKISPCSGTITITQLVFRLTNLNGLVNEDWSGVEILVDANLDGNITSGETTSVGGSGTVNQAAGTITFSTSFNVSVATSYILRADFASLSLGDQVTISLAAADISASDTVVGSTTSVTHKEKIECYFEKFETWTASSAATWQTKDLSGAPFNVPAGAVVEVAVRNHSTINERSGGVRSVGSALERRLSLREAEGGGTDVLVMHVQASADSLIQHYAENTADVDFVLLGYWTCGTYVETFATFTAGASAAWTDKSLCSYGVGQSHIAEIVMTNDDPANEREVGVRSNGSSLERRVSLTEAEDGGVDTVTMFVEADTSTTAVIEVYAQDDVDVDFYLVGYWSKAPLAYTEAFSDIGSPTASATWQDKDLTANGISDTAHAEFILANEDPNNERSMGVRENGSALARLLNLAEAQDGGSDAGRMQIASDLTATVEWYHSNIGSANSYYLVGEWDTCNGFANSYVITDLGAVTSTKRSLAQAISESGKIAAFEEDASGNAVAWMQDCGSFTSLGTLGGSYAEAHDINDSNRVVGWANNASGKRRAFSWAGGTMTDLGVILSRGDSEAAAVNNNAEVVGTVLDFGSPPRNRLGFIYLPVAAYSLSAGMNSLGTLGGNQSIAMDINDSGQVVGGAQLANGNYRPFRWQGGVMSNLGTLGGESAMPDHRAEAINASGDVCGRSYTAGGAKRAFLWDGSMMDLGVLSGGSESWAFGLNDRQVVVGTSSVSGGSFRAFVWDLVNGMRDLNNLIPAGSGWTLIRATDINESGVIVGWGTNGSGNVRAFMLTPTCKASGGGGAAFVVDQGSGTTDVDGVFEGVVTSIDGEPLGEFEVIADASALPVDYELLEAPPLSTVQLPPELATKDGFDDGIAIPRVLKVRTSDGAGVTVMVRMVVHRSEIDDLVDDPTEMQVHVLDRRSGALVWVPAGRMLGEMSPTDRPGDAGVMIASDGTAEYWAVHEQGGAFRVGKPIADELPPPAVTPAPRMCGIAAVGLLMPVMGVTWLWKRKARGG